VRRHEIKDFYARWAEPSHAADGLTFLERYHELLDGGFRGICVPLVGVSADAKRLSQLGLRFSGMVFGRPRDASTLSTLHLRSVTMEVHLFTRIFIWFRVGLFVLAIGSGTK
jgi:hypothetical protein